MKKFSKKTIKVVSSIQCDCCKQEFDTPVELAEFLTLDTVAGYNSIFGDGNKIQLDLCQYCLEEKLGDLIRMEKK